MQLTPNITYSQKNTIMTYDAFTKSNHPLYIEDIYLANHFTTIYPFNCIDCIDIDKYQASKKGNFFGGFPARKLSHSPDCIAPQGGEDITPGWRVEGILQHL